MLQFETEMKILTVNLCRSALGLGNPYSKFSFGRYIVVYTARTCFIATKFLTIPPQMKILYTIYPLILGPFKLNQGRNATQDGGSNMFLKRLFRCEEYTNKLNV